MTIDRDDPESRLRSEESDSTAAAFGSAPDVALYETVSAVVGEQLLREGLPLRAVEAILHDVGHEFSIFRQAIKEPRGFLVKRILAKAESWRKLRGIPPGPDPEEQGPHLLEVIRTRAALETLNRDARVALEILYYRNGSYEDVAQELGVALSYVPRLVRKALDALRKWRPQGEPREP